MKKAYALFALTLTVFILSACGGEKVTATVQQSVATVAPETALARLTPTPDSVEPTEPPTAAPTSTPESEQPSGNEAETRADTLKLSVVQPDLHNLSSIPLESYRLLVRWRVESKGEGEAASDLIEIKIAHTSDPLADEIEFYSQRAGDYTKFIRVGDRLWLQAGERWIEVSSDQMDFEQALFALDSAMGSFTGNAELVGEETLNDVATQHYVFDDSVLSSEEELFTDLRGEVWIAQEGGYVIKYLFTAKDAQATYEASWEIYDINAPLSIELPPDAEYAREELPQMPDATDRSSIGPVTTYVTASDQEAVVEFYQEEMAVLGWTFEENSSVVTGDYVMLLFTKDEDAVSVTLTPAEEGLLVVLQTD